MRGLDPLPPDLLTDIWDPPGAPPPRPISGAVESDYKAVLDQLHLMIEKGPPAGETPREAVLRLVGGFLVKGLGAGDPHLRVYHDAAGNENVMAMYDSNNVNVVAAVCLWHDGFDRLSYVGVLDPASLDPEGDCESGNWSSAASYSYDYQDRRAADDTKMHPFDSGGTLLAEEHTAWQLVGGDTWAWVLVPDREGRGRSRRARVRKRREALRRRA